MVKLLGNVFLVVIFIIGFTACGGSSSEQSTEPEPDTSVTSFEVESIAGAEPASEVISDPVTILGINQPVELSVDGCSYSINEQAYQTVSTTVKLNDTVAFKITSSAGPDTTVSCDITVSQFSTQFLVTTRLPMVEVSVEAKTTSKEYTPLLPDRVFLHDDNGQNISELPVDSLSVLIPKPSNGASYTLYKSVNIYGYEYQNLFTVYNSQESKVHKILPAYSHYRFDDCKTINLSKETLEQDQSRVSFFTFNSCNTTSGTGSRSVPATLSLPVSDDANGVNDLFFFIQDSNENILKYKLFSSSDYSHEETIDAENIVLDSEFNQLSVSIEREISGDLRVYGQTEDKYNLIGSHKVFEGSNNYVVNLVSTPYDSYYHSVTLRKGEQAYGYAKTTEVVPTILDDQIETKFILSANLTDNVLSWNIENQAQYSKVSVNISNGVEYFWRLIAEDNGYITIPNLTEVNRNAFLSNGAEVFIHLWSQDEVLTENVYAFGRLRCENEVCSLNVTLE